MALVNTRTEEDASTNERLRRTDFNLQGVPQVVCYLQESFRHSSWKSLIHASILLRYDHNRSYAGKHLRFRGTPDARKALQSDEHTTHTLLGDSRDRKGQKEGSRDGDEDISAYLCCERTLVARVSRMAEHPQDKERMEGVERDGREECLCKPPLRMLSTTTSTLVRSTILLDSARRYRMKSGLTCQRNHETPSLNYPCLQSRAGRENQRTQLTARRCLS